MGLEPRFRLIRLAVALGMVSFYSVGLAGGGVAQASSRGADRGGQGGGGAVFATISSFDPVSGTLTLVTPTGGLITGIVVNGLTQIHGGVTCLATTTPSTLLTAGRGVTQIAFLPGTNQFQSITLSGSGGGGNDDATGRRDGGGHCQGALFGTISSFDRVSGTLTLVTPNGGIVSGIVVRGTTRILPGRSCHGESHGLGMLKPGHGVSEATFFPGTNVFQTIGLAQGSGGGGDGDNDAHLRDGQGDNGEHHCHHHGGGGGDGND